jgi:hypothetical protein
MKLFGGALEIKLPKEGAGWHWIDCSTVRQVPDHQEIFMLNNRNVSIIIEILEESPMTVKDHFMELSECNEASETGNFKEDKDCEDRGYGWQLIRKERIFLGLGLKKEGTSVILISINSVDEDDMKFLKDLVCSIQIKDPSLFE